MFSRTRRGNESVRVSSISPRTNDARPNFGGVYSLGRQAITYRLIPTQAKPTAGAHLIPLHLIRRRKVGLLHHASTITWVRFILVRASHLIIGSSCIINFNERGIWVTPSGDTRHVKTYTHALKRSRQAGSSPGQSRSRCKHWLPARVTLRKLTGAGTSACDCRWRDYYRANCSSSGWAVLHLLQKFESPTKSPTSRESCSDLFFAPERKLDTSRVEPLGSTGFIES